MLSKTSIHRPRRRVFFQVSQSQNPFFLVFKGQHNASSGVWLNIYLSSNGSPFSNLPTNLHLLFIVVVVMMISGRWFSWLPSTVGCRQCSITTRAYFTSIPKPKLKTTRASSSFSKLFRLSLMRYRKSSCWWLPTTTAAVFVFSRWRCSWCEFG